MLTNILLNLVFPQKPESTVSRKKLRRCIALVGELNRLLPEIALTPRQRRALGGCGGTLSDFTPSLVILTTRNVKREPEVFAGYPASDPEDLDDRNQRAQLSWVLGNWMGQLARRAMDHHLVLDRGVLSDIMDLMRVTEQENHRYASPPARRRAHLLASVKQLLGMIAAHNQKKREKNARKKAQEDAE